MLPDIGVSFSPNHKIRLDLVLRVRLFLGRSAQLRWINRNLHEYHFSGPLSAGRYQHERPQNIVRRVTAQTSNWVRACVIHLHIQTIVLHVSDSLFPACIEAAVFSFYNFVRSFRLLSYIIISLLGFILHCLLILRRRPLLLCTMYNMTKLNGVKCGRM